MSAQLVISIPFELVFTGLQLKYEELSKEL